MASISYASICGDCRGLDGRHYVGCKGEKPQYPAIMDCSDHSNPKLVYEYLHEGCDSMEDYYCNLTEGEHELYLINYNGDDDPLGGVWMIGKDPNNQKEKVLKVKKVFLKVPNEFKGVLG